jgi:hypothetical protein
LASQGHNDTETIVKFRSPRTNRYNWYSKENVDFQKLAKEIKEV